MLTRVKLDRIFLSKVLKIMLPIMLQHLIVSSLNMTDTFMVGLLGEQYLSAVTLANVPFTVIMLMIFGLQSGSGILIAQYWGKGDKRTISRVLGVGIYAALFVTVSFALVAALMPEKIMAIVTNNSHLQVLGTPYVRIVGFSFVANSLSSIFIGAHRSIGNIKLGLYIFSFSMLLNTFLNWVLIFGKLGFPALGVAGAAISTLIARLAELLLAAVYMFKNQRLRPEPALMLRPGKLIFKDFGSYSVPVIINETFWGLGTSLFPVIMGHMAGSSVILAAYTICGNVERITMVVSMAIANASAIIVGNIMGTGDREKAYEAGVSLNALSFIVGLGCALLLLVLRSTLIEHVLYPLFRLSDEARRLSSILLLIIVIAMPAKNLNLANIVGVLRGGGDTKTAMLLDLATMYLFAVPLAALFGLVFKWDVIWVFIIINAEEVLKIFIGLKRLFSKRWMRNLTREFN